MHNKLNWHDTCAIGFMTFALFLGAGNIIFPPLAGQLAGDNYLLSVAGFLLTAVGMPLLGIIAMAVVGGGFETLTKHLPKTVGVVIGFAIYMAIGPMLAMPRTAVVAFEMGIVPFIGEESKQLFQAVWSVAFFAVAWVLAINPGKLMHTIGKVITPALIFLLLVISISTFIIPQGEIGAASGEWLTTPFSKGFTEGYLTMDTLAAMMFGMVIITNLKAHGITDGRALTKYCIYAGIIAAVGLSIVYFSLFYLGATSGGISPNGTNGAVIFTQYVNSMYGTTGVASLAAVIILACLTTAVGLSTAVSQYLCSLWPAISYRTMTTGLLIVCTIVANVGLSTLISISVPILISIYPVAIVLIILNLLKPVLRNPESAFGLTLAVTFAISLIDGLNVAGFEWAKSLQEITAILPLFEQSLGWLLPAIIALAISQAIPPRQLAAA
ncbi:branched-chain amino acid transport system II carrier protein [Pelagibaculum spongiae]|uniref:Branched-chain amino acid transport system carrier protein n=1 Tax=Pelagibaculum spongiae TaxID=2080658 RepID=A0A2V1GYZ5_9GAMM|nr:branched-chain amino acid transport system II carrier protein [Pelagibaculum spongiae]PVZ71669.1 branched-chain amino acid transport system II carrier protein [Pelagibaculum spongiae]